VTVVRSLFILSVTCKITLSILPNLDSNNQRMESYPKKKIYVIEDNKTEGMLLKLCLGSIKNIVVKNFTQGYDLINRIKETPDIVIVDMMLPDITGEELIRSLKEDYPEIEIIVVSAQKDIDLIARVQELGIYNYLVKSEACMEYLQKTIEDLIFLIDHKRKAG
jgi:two-component system, chemotaxis family, chemotaxis protein CheY